MSDNSGISGRLMTCVPLSCQELLEKALEGIVKQEREQRDPRELQNLSLQRKNIDTELLRVRQQLADSSKVGASRHRTPVGVTLQCTLTPGGSTICLTSV